MQILQHITHSCEEKDGEHKTRIMNLRKRNFHVELHTFIDTIIGIALVKNCIGIVTFEKFNNNCYGRYMAGELPYFKN